MQHFERYTLLNRTTSFKRIEVSINTPFASLTIHAFDTVKDHIRSDLFRHEHRQ